MDVQAVITAVNTRLDTIAGLRVFDHPVGQLPVPATVTSVATGRFLTYDTSTGSHDLMLQVRLFVTAASDRAGHTALNAYLANTGASSVKTAIEADQTLGGTTHFVAVTAVSGFGTYAVGDQELFGCTFDVMTGCY